MAMSQLGCDKRGMTMKQSDILCIIRRVEGILEGIAAFKGATITDEVSGTLLDCCESLDIVCDAIEGKEK